MISIKSLYIPFFHNVYYHNKCIIELVPSSARSSASVATPLPPQFAPLLNDTLERAKTVIDRVMPMEKRLSALEEAQFEDDGEEGALEREMLMQCLSSLIVGLNVSDSCD